ncbi:MAG: protocatechuate 3,4-dioxygenase subunit alpha [Pseudomonadota bacterium]
MVQDLGRLKESASQTGGPYVHIGCTPNFCGIDGIYDQDLGAFVAGPGVPGTRISISGQIFDGTGTPLRDALIEIWQADGRGRYPPATPDGFTGFGRCPTDLATGEYRFETIKPGPVPFKDGRPMAPHITFWIAARGINIGLQTRLYFPDEADANKADPMLGRIEHQNRVPTLIAKGEMPHYRFDIRLQGPDETIFFDI